MIEENTGEQIIYLEIMFNKYILDTATLSFLTVKKSRHSRCWTLRGSPSSSAAGSGRGQKRETKDILEPSVFQTKDKTGKAARSAPKTPGALEGDVMMADVETKDHWRISDTYAIRVHVE